MMSGQHTPCFEAVTRQVFSMKANVFNRALASGRAGHGGHVGRANGHAGGALGINAHAIAQLGLPWVVRLVPARPIYARRWVWE